jgi:uncharacterized protein with PIN domain
MANVQSICGNCSQPIHTAISSITINPDGWIEITLICFKCGRKFYKGMGVEEFEVVKNDWKD